MNIKFFEGPAGTGKTTSLINELIQKLELSPLQEGQRILGLTFMHGSRRRMIDRLSQVKGLNRQFDCLTFDSFAWRLICRWRSIIKIISPGFTFQEIDYESTCNLAAQLLELPEVINWLNRTYPIVIIDESQDLKASRLAITQQLSKSLKILIAGDEFQDLFSEGPNPAISWLRSVTKPVSLQVNYRTKNQDLLKAANALHEGTRLSNGEGFLVLTAQNANVAAAHIVRSLVYNGFNNVVILTPVKPATSNFINDAIIRVTKEPIIINSKYGTKKGPYKIHWELDSEAIQESIKSCVGLPDRLDLKIKAHQLNLSTSSFGVVELKNWLDNQRKTRGRTEFSVGELTSQIQRITQRMRAYKNDLHGVKAMTIQQAKNREFEGVIVLWPFQIRDSQELQRRLLYNAITRAKKWVVVVVQDYSKGKQRLKKAPFFMSE